MAFIFDAFNNWLSQIRISKIENEFKKRWIRTYIKPMLSNNCSFTHKFIDTYNGIPYQVHYIVSWNDEHNYSNCYYTLDVIGHDGQCVASASSYFPYDFINDRSITNNDVRDFCIRLNNRDFLAGISVLQSIYSRQILFIENKITKLALTSIYEHYRKPVTNWKFAELMFMDEYLIKCICERL